jgi:hypothetical protein
MHRTDLIRPFGVMEPGPDWIASTLAPSLVDRGMAGRASETKLPRDRTGQIEAVPNKFVPSCRLAASSSGLAAAISKLDKPQFTSDFRRSQRTSAFLRRPVCPRTGEQVARPDQRPACARSAVDRSLSS